MSSVPSASDAGGTQSGGTQSKIHDLGYRGYDGPRLGPGYAMRAGARVSIERALGLRRSARWKIAPIFIIMVTFLPSIVLVGISAISNDTAFISVGSYFGTAAIMLVIFSAFAGSEVVTADIKSGMASLYASSQLGPKGFLGSKLLGIFAVTFGVTAGPALLQVLALFLQDGYSALGDGFQDVGAVIAVSALIASMFTALVVGISFVTRDFRIAMVAVLLIAFVSVGVAESLASTSAGQSTGFTESSDGSIRTFSERDDVSNAATAAAMFSPISITTELGLRAFDAPRVCNFSFEGGDNCEAIHFPGAPTALFIIAAFLWIIAGLGLALGTLNRSLR
ncbi:MAG: hypothetical protein KAZ88_15785 [Acidimicrobiia bacterium]|jgi:ABC-2 type transport system permease protein|nr:hypothetical protein [Acidimicrobiia bacterium]MBP8182432.1 hypothetical protein [Acidimicrobiia bacterium]